MGLFVGPISAKDTTTKTGEMESEYLMPPCQLQLLGSYENNKGQIVIKAKVVFDKPSLARSLRLGFMEKESAARRDIEKEMENERVEILENLNSPHSRS